MRGGFSQLERFQAGESSEEILAELRRIAVRTGQGQAAVTAILTGIDLYELPRSGCAEAGMLAGPNWRTLDALHLVGARRLSVDGIIVYDMRMVSAASELGLPTFAPGR